MTFRILAIALLCIGMAAWGEAIPADSAPGFVPLGAYLSWERIAACARVQGIDKWDDVGRRLDLLEASHVNLLWVTNMSEQDLPRLAEECGNRGMKLLPCLDTVEAKVEWRWADAGYYEEVLPRVVDLAAGKSSIAGWVLSDEPLEKDFPRLETLRSRLRDLDPGRFSTAVFMWPQAPVAPPQVNLPVFCVDLYPFFGPNDPNGPYTDDASRNFYRGHARKMLDAIAGSPAIGWVMGMCFSDIWGPRKYDGKGHLVGLPGSYLHWRAPTLAEMRWQVWEAFRAGAKGFICYTLAPEAPDPATASAAPPDVTWKEVLAREEVDLGPNALTNPDGSVTPQLTELGRVYALLAPHAALIRGWQRREVPGFEAAAPCQAQTFVDAAGQVLYAVVVNDDFQELRTASLRFGEPVVSVTDIVRGQDVDAVPDPAGKGFTSCFPLDAGEGTILRMNPASK